MDNGLPQTENAPLQATVVVSNPKGLHMRAAFAFAKLAGKFKASVTVRKLNRTVNGKSGLSLITLAAEPGTELLMEVVGEDASDAFPILKTALGSPSTDGLNDLRN